MGGTLYQPKPSHLTLLRFIAEVNAEYQASITPETRRIYEVARYLCESDGNHPDAIAVGSGSRDIGPMRFMSAPEPSACLLYPIRPAWALYWIKSRDSIEVVEKAPRSAPTTDRDATDASSAPSASHPESDARAARSGA